MQRACSRALELGGSVTYPRIGAIERSTSAKTILAINTDRDAPMVTRADASRRDCNENGRSNAHPRAYDSQSEVATNRYFVRE